MLIRKFIFGKVTRLFSQRFLKRFSHKNTYTKDLRVPGVQTFFVGSSWGRAAHALATTESQVLEMRRANALRAGRVWVVDEQTRQLRAELALSQARLAAEHPEL